MASIRQMPRGRWQQLFVAKVIVLKSRHSTPSRMLKQWARLIEPEIDRAVFVDRGPSERVTIQELADRYTREVVPKKKSSGSIQRTLRFACRHFGT